MLLVTLFFKGTIGTAEGSALVKLGNTTVICGIKGVSVTNCRSDIILSVIKYVTPEELSGYNSDITFWVLFSICPCNCITVSVILNFYLQKSTTCYIVHTYQIIAVCTYTYTKLRLLQDSCEFMIHCEVLLSDVWTMKYNNSSSIIVVSLSVCVRLSDVRVWVLVWEKWSSVFEKVCNCACQLVKMAASAQCNVLNSRRCPKEVQKMSVKSKRCLYVR